MGFVSSVLSTILDILFRIPGIYLSWVKAVFNIILRFGLWLLIVPAWALADALQIIIRKVGEFIAKIHHTVSLITTTIRKITSWTLTREIRIRIFSKTTLFRQHTERERGNKENKHL